MDSTKTKIDTTDVDAATTYSLLITFLTALALAAGSYVAYQQGYLDPLIEKVGGMLFKAKAVAEAKEMQAKGMAAGTDFVDCKCRSFVFLSLTCFFFARETNNDVCLCDANCCGKS